LMMRMINSRSLHNAPVGMTLLFAMDKRTSEQKALLPSNHFL
jgi:hypothetical protein